MESYLEEIIKNTRCRESISLVVSGKSSLLNTTYNPPINLNSKSRYEMALVNLETYYSFPNVDEKNNTLNFSKDTGKNWDTIKILKGCYEIHSLNAEITRQIGCNNITIRPNLNTLKCILTVKDHYMVDFNVENSLRTLLGFDAKRYSQGIHQSENIVNILRLNSILVHTDIVTSSYINGRMEPVIYTFFPNVSPGEKIITRPINLTYLPLTVDTIYRMRTWLSDQDNYTLDLRGEVVTIRFHVREI